MNICIQNLGMYNEGYLCFKWITLPMEEAEIQAALKEIGIGREYEEYFIADYEPYCGYRPGEYENLGDLNELAERVEQLHRHQREALEAIMETDGGDFEDAIEIIENGNYSFYAEMSMVEVAEYLVEEENYFGELPEEVKGYIDYEAVATTLQTGGNFSEASNGVICIHW